MIWRKGDDDHRSHSSAPDGLIAQLEAGSGVAENRLAALVASSFAASDGDSKVLDSIAVSAADGSPYSLELLLGLIVEHDLAGPSIGRVVNTATTIEDVEQEVLVAVARSVHRYRGDAKFTTWLYALARNVAVSHLRKIRPTSELGADDLLDDGARRRMSSLVAERDVVREAIHSLPPKFRQTVLLRDIEGLSYAEIAEREGLEINTVRSRLSRGRAMLALKLP